MVYRPLGLLRYYMEFRGFRFMGQNHFAISMLIRPYYSVQYS